MSDAGRQPVVVDSAPSSHVPLAAGTNREDGLRSIFAETAVVPVLSLLDPSVVLELADALSAGGLSVLEVTFRTEAAAGAIETIVRHRPHVVVGAGTVLDAATVGLAAAAGAGFIVSPGFSEAVAEACAAFGLPYLPGAVTATEIQRCLDAGYRTVKFFPAETAGGVRAIRLLSGPFSTRGVSFVPTGGVTPASLESYLREQSVVAVGGSWLAPSELIRARAWPQITELARKAAATARSIRRDVG
jgi:2-dehydro-3-deoxyphosphogluconate aldolase/(4S)-4-hydroxy-2-oxoglutarate aldolase